MYVQYAGLYGVDWVQLPQDNDMSGCPEHGMDIQFL